MCLLAVLFRRHEEAPLIVAANRDEALSRPASSIQLLENAAIPIIGGRDEMAGGTWLAINRSGVVAGLTNRVTGGPRDPSKRSRGELPLVLTRQRSAAEGIESLRESIRPSDYNPGWLLAGDREHLFYVAMPGNGRLEIRELEPGMHLLENEPLEAASAKTGWIRDRLVPVRLRTDSLVEALQPMLASHEVPPGEHARPAATRAVCVHSDGFGTRSSTVAWLPTDPDRAPHIRYADGPPCNTAFESADGLWS